MITTFGEILAAGRTTAGMTQVELAKASKLNRVYIAQLESGLKTDPSYRVVKMLCRSLGPEFTEAIKADLQSDVISMRKPRRKIS